MDQFSKDRREGLPPGTCLGPYRILEPLGAGGMGDVYRAVDGRLERSVALKVLPSDMADDLEHLRRFEREGKSLAALNHPNIVTIHDVGEADGVSYLAMELVEGRVLGELIPPGGVGLGTFFDIALPLTEALATAHERGVLHRDLKPENVMYTREGRVKVVDFGLAKRRPFMQPAVESLLPTQSLEEMTREGTLVGTVPYMSPEQLQGRKVDHRSDIFSLGVLLHEVLTGERPFDGADPATLVSSILRDDPLPLSRSRPGLPRDLDLLLRRCLEKAPEDRVQTMREVHRELGRLREEMATDVTPTVAASSLPTASSPPAASRSSRRRVLRRGLWAGGVLVALAVVAVLWPRSDRDPAGPAAPAGAIETIAVLPLEAGSGGEGERRLADGIAHALSSDLAKIAALDVISSTSSMQVRDAAAPLAEVAERLGADAVIQGRVGRQGDEVEVDARLVDVRSGQTVWRQAYRHEIRRVESLQGRIVRDVAQHIDVAVTPEERALLDAERVVDPQAFDAYLQGRHLWKRRHYGQAVPHFLRAVELDPEFALAYAGLADTYLVLAHFARPAGEAMPLARDAASRALELDPTLAEAHASLADVAFHWEWDWQRAEREFRRALELNPGYATGHCWYAGLLSALGRHEEAIAEIRRAQQLDPLHQDIHALAIRVFAWARRPEAVHQQAVSFRRRFPESHPEPYALALAGKGGPVAEEVVGELETRSERVFDPYPKAVLAVTLAGAGRHQTARRLLDELHVAYESVYVSPYVIALAHAMLGETGEALDWLEEARDRRAAELIWIAVEPGFDGLRDEPRFRAIVEAMEFPSRGHKTSGGRSRTLPGAVEPSSASP